MRTLATLTFSLSLIGCTKWSTTTKLGPAREVGRQPKGMPSFATSSSSSVAAGFAGRSAGPRVAAGFGAGTESYTRTRCEQDVDVAYEQTFEVHPIEVGRSKDRIAAIALGAAGVLLIASSADASNEPYFEVSPTAAYLVGGGLLAAGGGLLVYSYTSLPRDPKPEVSRGVNRWVATETAPAHGCTQPTAPAPVVVQTLPTPANVQSAPSTPGDTSERLRALDKLKASGTISADEYKRKRAAILEDI